MNVFANWNAFFRKNKLLYIIMNNKSIIQLQLESIQSKSKFEQDIKDILEHYDVKDCVFGVNEGAYEMTNGYFIPLCTYDNLTEAVREMNTNQAIRIVENEDFIVGDVYKCLSDCADNKEVFNIEFLENVY
jgi:hypothetical protein